MRAAWKRNVSDSGRLAPGRSKQLRSVGAHFHTSSSSLTLLVVESLASLFRGMIETPQPSIRPETELARLTLETESVKEKMRRRSTLQTDRPSLAQIDNPTFHGPLSLEEYERNAITGDAILQSPTD